MVKKLVFMKENMDDIRAERRMSVDEILALKQ
jgi:hypothetical protein